MRIDALELHVVRLALQHPFATAQATTATRDVLLVHARSADGEGWGECAAETTPAYWYESVASAWASLGAVDLSEDRSLQQQLVAVGAGPMARAALEMAVLDLQLHTADTALAAHLGAVRTTVDATVTAGLVDDVEQLLAAGYRSLKVKVAPGAVPALAYPGVTVQADANGSLDPIDDRRVLDELDAAGLALIEQPFAIDQLEAYAALELATPVCLDESITSLADTLAAIAVGVCQAVCIKPSRLGGFAAAMAVRDACAAAGLTAKVGGMLETGIGRAAALALAATPGFELPADLSAAERYWAEDIVTAPARLDALGRLTVPTGPGLGIEVRLDAVAAATVEHTVLRR